MHVSDMIESRMWVKDVSKQIVGRYEEGTTCRGRSSPPGQDIPDFPLLGWKGAALAARGDRPVALFRALVSGAAGVNDGESTFRRFFALHWTGMSLCSIQQSYVTTDLSD